jgi:hypothetical protein
MGEIIVRLAFVITAPRWELCLDEFVPALRACSTASRLTIQCVACGNEIRAVCMDVIPGINPELQRGGGGCRLYSQPRFD